MSRRSRAREVVLQILYQDDLNPSANQNDVELFLVRRLQQRSELIEFARGLLAGVRGHRQEVDEIISAGAANWSLKRMAATDRNIIRLGAYEILFSDTPGVVAINEAVELAKRYGARQSPQFVNGILDRCFQCHLEAGGS